MPKLIRKIHFAIKKHKYELSKEELREYEKLRKRRYRYIKNKKKRPDALFRNYKNGDMHDEYYTPEHYFYEAIGDIENTFKVKVQNPRINKIFKPGGDFEHEIYNINETIVDNPPFSLIHKIVDFYNERGIKFVLFFSNPIFFKRHAERKGFESNYSAILQWKDISNWINITKNISISLITNIPQQITYFERKKGKLVQWIPDYKTDEFIKQEIEMQKIKLKNRGWKF